MTIDLIICKFEEEMVICQQFAEFANFSDMVLLKYKVCEINFSISMFLKKFKLVTVEVMSIL